MLYLELFCKYNTLIQILDYSAMKKTLSFVRHCQNYWRKSESVYVVQRWCKWSKRKLQLSDLQRVEACFK